MAPNNTGLHNEEQLQLLVHKECRTTDSQFK